jgi:hypothetical protein
MRLNGHMMLKLSELFDIRTGYTFRDSVADLEHGDIGVVQAGDVNAARLSKIPRINFSGDKHLLEVGDIVLSARGGGFISNSSAPHYTYD